jgi:WD40 repeat protein
MFRNPLRWLLLITALQAFQPCSSLAFDTDQGIQFSQDGTRIVTGGGGGFMVFSVKTGKRVFQHRFKENGLWPARHSVSISSDGRYAVAGLSYAGAGTEVHHRIELFDINKGKRVRSLVTPWPGVWFSKDGKLAVGNVAGGSVIWGCDKLPDLEPLLSRRDSRSVPSVSPDSALIAISVGSAKNSSKGTVELQILDAKNELKTSRILKTSFEGKIKCCFSPDSSHLLVTDNSSKVEVFSLAEPSEPIASLGLAKRINTCQFIQNSSGLSLIIAFPNDVRVWPIDSEKEAEQIFAGSESGHGIRAVVNKTCNRALISEFNISESKSTWTLIDLRDYQVIRKFKPNRPGSQPIAVFSPSGETFLAVAEEGIGIYDSSAGTLVKEIF